MVELNTVAKTKLNQQKYLNLDTMIVIAPTQQQEYAGKRFNVLITDIKIKPYLLVTSHIRSIIQDAKK